MNGSMNRNIENIYIKIKYLEIKKRDDQRIDIFSSSSKSIETSVLVLSHPNPNLPKAKSNF